MSRPLTLHADRAFPADPGLRSIARRIYEKTAGLPLVCMHGHVEAADLAADERFSDPAELLVVPDHYVTRMLVSQGIPLERLGVPSRDASVSSETDSRAVWRLFCANWHLYRGTPSRYWLEHELVDVFGVTERPSAESADRIYDRIEATIARPEFRRLALLDRFGIELLATTDAATSDLAHHARLRERGYGDRVIPTFRPDAVVHPDRPAWRADVDRLGELADVDTGSYPGFLQALRLRRQAFVDAGALATDHGHVTADTTPLPEPEAARIFAAGRAGAVSAQESAAFAAHMLYAMAEMSCEDGLVMQIHPGVLRDHHDGIAAGFGADQGFDIPVPVDFTRGLRPMLQAFGHSRNFRSILFTIDETVYSRELAPLPVPTRRCAWARRGGSSTPPPGCGASARPPPRPPASTTPRVSSTTPAPSPRSRPATT